MKNLKLDKVIVGMLICATVLLFTACGKEEPVNNNHLLYGEWEYTYELYWTHRTDTTLNFYRNSDERNLTREFFSDCSLIETETLILADKINYATYFYNVSLDTLEYVQEWKKEHKDMHSRKYATIDTLTEDLFIYTEYVTGSSFSVDSSIWDIKWISTLKRL